jgi:3-keto-5-aminohexanoate cleavage enzyme
MGMNGLAVMVALNGARKGRAEHENLPITQEDIASAAADLANAGAHAIHMHVRDDAGAHSLDARRYSQTSEAVRQRAGRELIIQITTEAVGRYSPAEQIEVVRAVRPEAVSIAMKELIPDPSAEDAARDLYHWAYSEKIAVQHIAYTVDELKRVLDLIERGIIPGERYSLMLPLGRYVANQESDPAELIPFLATIRDSGKAERIDWWTCAFGHAETAAAIATAALGGHVRIGFENSFFNADGSRAADNVERLADVRPGLDVLHRLRLTRGETLRVLGRPD